MRILLNEIVKRETQEELRKKKGSGLLPKIENVYRVSKNMLGEIAHPVIQRHCTNGIKNVNQGKGLPAVIETATQIVKAAQILEGSEKTKELTAKLKKIIRDP